MTEIVKNIAPEVQDVITRVVSEEMDSAVEVDSTLQKNRDQVLVAVARILQTAGIHSELTEPNIEVREAPLEKEKSVLDPESRAAILVKLKIRFKAYPGRHGEMTWVDVERSLEADPRFVWSLNEMEKAAHEPDVYMEDEEAFYFGTCVKETPEMHRNCVYDTAAQNRLSQFHTPDGNAEEIVSAMGVELMPEANYIKLQEVGIFDTRTRSYLRTPPEVRETGLALIGRRNILRVVKVKAKGYDKALGLRATLRVPKVKA